MARIPKKIRRLECYPGSLSHDMRALTVRSIASAGAATGGATVAATRSLGLHRQEFHMGAHHVRLETASNQLLL